MVTMIEMKEKILDFFYSIPRILFINFFKLFVRIRVFNIKNIPKDKSAILAINHTTGADPIVLLGAVGKKIHFIVSAKNFSTRFTAFFMRKFSSSLPIYKECSAKNTSTFKELFLISKKYRVLFGIFPEGNLNKNGNLAQFHKGAAYLSFKTGLPIIPVYLHNLRKGVKPESFIARSNVAEGIISIIANTFQKINIFVGDPINLTAEMIEADFKGPTDVKNYKSTISQINETLSEEFSELEEKADEIVCARAKS